MNAHRSIREADEVAVTGSWAESALDRAERSRRIAWIVAAVAAAVAVLLAVAIIVLLPLKTVEPYTLLVDRQTGHVEALAPLDEQLIAPDTALTRSFLVQYVIARESFDADSFDRDYGRVTLWSAGDARQRYINAMQPGNPLSPLAYMPGNGTIRTEIRSVSPLGADRALVRFSTVRTDPGAQPQPPEHWAAVVEYAFSEAPMSEADRLVNPLGFQVTSYRRDAETLPEAAPVMVAPVARRAPAVQP